MSALVRGRAALAAGQVTDGLVRDLCDEIEDAQALLAVAHDRADAARELLDAEIAETARITAMLSRANGPESRQGIKARRYAAQRDAALAAIERVRAAHPPFSLPDGTQLCETCEDKYSYPFDWPCPTIQALGDQ